MQIQIDQRISQICVKCAELFWGKQLKKMEMFRFDVKRFNFFIQNYFHFECYLNFIFKKHSNETFHSTKNKGMLLFLLFWFAK